MLRNEIRSSRKVCEKTKDVRDIENVRDFGVTALSNSKVLAVKLDELRTKFSNGSFRRIKKVKRLDSSF